MMSTASSGAVGAGDVLSSVVVFTGKSVRVNDGPTDTGSVGTGEGAPSETAEDAEDGDTAMTNIVVVGMTVEREAKTEVRSSIALISPSEGAGVGERDDSVKGGVV